MGEAEKPCTYMKTTFVFLGCAESAQIMRASFPGFNTVADSIEAM